MARQVGGMHYHSAFAHWDWVLAIGMQYLEGNATKYLARWDKKGSPLMDLEKALSYVTKLEETVGLSAIQSTRTRPSLSFITVQTERFCDENRIVGSAYQAIFALACWQTASDLGTAAWHIRQLIAEVRPVPLEDSNKHALQPGDE
jgi:hypothetical protein